MTEYDRPVDYVQKKIDEEIDKLEQDRKLFLGLLDRFKDHPLYNDARRFLEETLLNDPNTEWKRASALNKLLGTHHDGVRQMVNSQRALIKDRAVALRLEWQRNKQFAAGLTKALAFIENPDVFSADQRAKLKKDMERAIGRIERIS